jgi:diacylglycerol O-acyltransferase / wax synthase
MATSERLSSLDSSFLYMERPSVHMHVAGLSILDPRPDGPLLFDDVRRVLEARIHLAPRLRQRVVHVPGSLGRPVWVDDDRFDLEFHLRRSALPEPGGHDELSNSVGRILSRPLDRAKPLWELYVFEGMEKGRTAVLLKLHHAMADGLAGMAIGTVLFDLQPGTPLGEPERWQPEPAPQPAGLIVDALEQAVRDPIDTLRTVVEAPSRAIEVVSETVAGARAIAGMGRRPAGPFDVRIGPNRRFAMAEAPFERLREIRAKLGGTINDVVVAAVAEGLHDLLRERGEFVRGRELRLMVPVSVRTSDATGESGNRVAPAFVDVPVGPMSPRGRLARVRRATAELKESSMAESADQIIALGAYAPPVLHAAAARLASRGQWFNLVVSNVPAPQVPMYLAGAPLLASYPSMPLGENAALSVACTSLGGTMAFGLTADWDAVPDLEVLSRGIERAIDHLTDAARG